MTIRPPHLPHGLPAQPAPTAGDTRPTWQFIKGHGTENDFIVLPDPDGLLNLTPQDVRRLCDRRAGIGADGVLRVVRSAAHRDAAAMADQAEWFMDYWNADGSQGQMCGNGIRVFARYLIDAALTDPAGFAVATRAGIRQVRSDSTERPGDWITVAMGSPRLPGPEAVQVTVAARQWSAVNVDMGNPHAVALVDDLAHAGDLLAAPTVEPADAYPEGVTVEFVVSLGPRHLAMRVHERGVGETHSCGTGACAAVTAAILRDTTPRPRRSAARYTVDVPGGSLHVTVLASGAMELSGPALLVARGTVSPSRLGPTPTLAPAIRRPGPGSFGPGRSGVTDRKRQE
ncbi:diaminopimelate epimerase [Streptomyces sp. 846.5]|nr:diaminopimelate epimerase [Streptomyces sp. 846.5]TDT93323.1 diaminopimelate epimerase [Streptomyces sp. 846.5]